MTRGRWIWSEARGEMVPAEEYYAEKYRDVQRSGLPTPQIISDFAEPVLNHADGQTYTSKRAYEKAVARAGCEIVGNEKLPGPQKYEPEGVGRDIKRSIDELKS